MSFFGGTKDETLDQCREELRGCESLNEMFRVLDKHYDLDRKVGSVAKGTILTALPKLITITGAKKR